MAQGDNLPVGARSAGMAHSSVTLYDVWSVHHNQAGLGWLENPEAGIFYENRFLLSELSYRGGVFAYPTKSGTFGLSVQSYGFNLYSENKYGLAYGRKLSEKVSAGIQLNYHTLRIAENYGNTNGISVEAGIQARLTEKLAIGVHVFNPNRTKVAEFEDERIPTIFRLGMNYTFSEKVFVTAEVEKDIDFNPVFKAGVEYHATDMLYLRGGVSTEPVLASFGFGLELKQFRLDIANTFHQTLGHTPQVSLQYAFK